MTDAFELPSTLVQALQRRAALTPDRVALRFLAETQDQAVVLSYRELDQRARTIAGALQAEAGFGDRPVLLVPSGPDYGAGFFGFWAMSPQVCGYALIAGGERSDADLCQLFCV